MPRRHEVEDAAETSKCLGILLQRCRNPVYSRHKTISIHRAMRAEGEESAAPRNAEFVRASGSSGGTGPSKRECQQPGSLVCIDLQALLRFLASPCLLWEDLERANLMRQDTMLTAASGFVTCFILFSSFFPVPKSPRNALNHFERPSKSQKDTANHG